MEALPLEVLFDVFPGVITRQGLQAVAALAPTCRALADAVRAFLVNWQHQLAADFYAHVCASYKHKNWKVDPLSGNSTFQRDQFDPLHFSKKWAGPLGVRKRARKGDIIVGNSFSALIRHGKVCAREKRTTDNLALVSPQLMLGDGEYLAQCATPNKAAPECLRGTATTTARLPTCSVLVGCFSIGVGTNICIHGSGCLAFGHNLVVQGSNLVVFGCNQVVMGTNMLQLSDDTRMPLRA